MIMNKLGFTLIELLLAISVFGILSSIVIIGYRNNEAMRNFETQALKMVDGLNSAQNQALTGALIDGVQPDAFRFVVSDCQNNCFYKIIALSGNNGDLTEKTVEEVSLPELSVNFDSGSELQVDFKVPRAVIESNISGPSIKLSLTGIRAEKADGSPLEYCLLINTISGRFELLANACSSL